MSDKLEIAQPILPAPVVSHMLSQSWLTHLQQPLKILPLLIFSQSVENQIVEPLRVFSLQVDQSAMLVDIMQTQPLPQLIVKSLSTLIIRWLSRETRLQALEHTHCAIDVNHPKLLTKLQQKYGQVDVEVQLHLYPIIWEQLMLVIQMQLGLSWHAALSALLH